MNNLEKLGFDNWYIDKVDLSKPTDFKIARVISVNQQTLSKRRLKSSERLRD